MTRRIPNYELYGDLLAGRAPDPIHLEPIKERSSQHDWTIRVHEHQRLAQIFLFRSPGVFFSLGDAELTTSHPTLLVVHPGVRHGFRFTEDVVGDVLSIRLEEAKGDLNARFASFENPTQSIFSAPKTPKFAAVVSLFDQLERVYHSLDSQRTDLMAALVNLIVLYLQSDQHQVVAPTPARKTEHRGRQDLQAEAFCALLEECFGQSMSVADYAVHLGLSAPHLTRICRVILGASPNQLVRQRRILEAKRLLQYTTLPLAEVAHRCGFHDAAYFSRTFKRFEGIPPNEYRFGTKE